jgi:hypothetical protein
LSPNKVCNIEQSKSRGPRQPDLSSLKSRSGGKSLPRNGVIEMEDPRCRIAAMEMEDPRCNGLLRGVVIEMEDPRCESLSYRVALEMEDPRCRRATVEMEDPRCKDLRNW